MGVVIHRLRRKLTPHGIEIVTIWGHGYRLAEGGRDRAHKLLTEHDAESMSAPP